MNKNTTTLNRNTGIDILRGLAILSVIFLHLNIRVPFSETSIGQSLPKEIYKILFWSGYYGVCIFFVISGFLITNSSLNKWGELPNIRPQKFYWMRFARIIPLLLILLAVLSVLHLAGAKGFVINPKHTTLGRAIFAALTFHINWLEIKTGYLPGAWDVLWSLSIEEFFYFFFPLVWLVLRKEWHFVFLVLIFLVISPFARISWFHDINPNLADKNHFAYLDAIALGCLAAIICRRVNLKRNHLIILAIAGWCFVSLVFFFRPISRQLHLGQTGLNITVLSLGTAMVLIWMQKRMERGKQFKWRYPGVFRFLGRNSYEIYLTHMFVVYVLFNIYKKQNFSGEWAWGLYIATIILSGVLGELVARYISNPANRYLRRF